MGEKEEIDITDNPNNLLEPFKVYVRIRPFLKREILRLKRSNSTSLLPGGNISNRQKNLESIFTINKNILYLRSNKNHKKEKKFFFNNIFTEKNNNKDVFDISIKPIINNIINGYNSTALAYGVTGTGKTHTIFGDLVFKNGEEGISIKACDYLFKELSSKYFEDNCVIKISYIEIYNENVIDLLNNDNSTSSNLMIIEDPNKGVYCPNMKEYIITNCLELKKIISKGNKKRTMAPTNQNKFSSRSHAILQISLERRSFNEENDNFDIFFSKFLMVDLAGSERGGLEKGKRREEGANINKSLFTLGSCINILSDKNKSGKFIPYRDSKLTRLLKDSLGGNILTVMLVCVSPSNESYEESLSSLNYATRAKKIKKKIYQNKKEIDLIEGNNNINFCDNNNNQYEEIIGSLKNEIYQLKNIIKDLQNKLRNKNINLINETLNLEDESIIKDKQNTPNNIEKYFFNDCSIISNIIMNDSQINLRNNNNINNNINDINNINNNKINDIDNNNINNNNPFPINFSLINNINEIDLEKYNIFFEEIKNKDFDINSLQKQIEDIKNDKNILELYLEKSNIYNNNNTLEKIINENNIQENNNNPEKKYITIRKYYDKFLEIINDKLIENIEHNMLLKCNIKEITELNKNNLDSLDILNKKLENYKLNQNVEDHNCEYNDINEKIKNIKNTIKENLTQKNVILKAYDESMNKKKILKQILVSLLGDKRENSDKLINIMKDKEKLVEKNKKIQKKMEAYLQIQKKKDYDINIEQREVEMLRAKLKEKERKIIELQKFNLKRNNSNSNNKKNNIYLNYINKNKNSLNSFINKGKKSNSCIKSANNLYHNNLRNKNHIKDDKKYKENMYCYDLPNNGNTITINNYNNKNDYLSKKFSNKLLNIVNETSNNKKKHNNRKFQSRSEELRLENKRTINDNNNYLFKKIMFNNNEDDNVRINTINVMDSKIGMKKYKHQNENHINVIKLNKKNENIINSFIIKNNSRKIIFNNIRNSNKKSVNLSQRRYEKFMNNHFNNDSHNKNLQDNYMSRKMNNKRLSLNEARFEKKLKKEKIDKKRDISVELNHIHAEYFINNFKWMKVKMSKNNIHTQGNENINNVNNVNIVNNIKNINNQNSTINMEVNCQIETKGNDTTNFKTDQSKILKTDDLNQDLINSIRNVNFKFKHK